MNRRTIFAEYNKIKRLLARLLKAGNKMRHRMRKLGTRCFACQRHEQHSNSAVAAE